MQICGVSVFGISPSYLPSSPLIGSSLENDADGNLYMVEKSGSIYVQKAVGGMVRLTAETVVDDAIEVSASSE
jgi:hypothetical protein